MGQGLAATLILVKVILLSGKDHLGFRNMCHIALACGTERRKDLETWRTYFRARVAARKQRDSDTVLEEFEDVQSFKIRISLIPLPLSSLVVPRPFFSSSKSA